ncbi:MAG: YdcF family protein, partial [Propylenella sp.]
MLYLSKLLPVFVYPLGAAIVLGALALALLFLGYLRTARWLLAAILAALWVVSTPLFANWITVRLEGRFPPQAVDALPAVDAIILLGGVLDRPASGTIPADLGEAADRLLHAARLFRAGKAPRIVVTGGNLPWTGGAPESETLAELLIELGVPRPALIIETKSVNTRESGVNVAATFREKGWRTGLLVTSGTHMRRALVVFRAAG